MGIAHAIPIGVSGPSRAAAVSGGVVILRGLPISNAEDGTASHQRFDLALPRARQRLAGLWLSLLVHLLLIGLAILRGDRLGSRTPALGLPMQRAGGGGGGGGGGSSVTYITLPPEATAAAAAPVETPRVKPIAAVPRVPPPVVLPRPAPSPAPPPVDTPAVTAALPDSARAAAGAGIGAGIGAGQGIGNGSGEGSGVGTGTGGTTGTGTGGQGGVITPPELRAFALVLDKTPKELRGREIEVTWWVDAQGGVARVETVPEIADGDYRRRFLETAEAARFRPARSPAGLPMPATFTAKYTLPTK